MIIYDLCCDVEHRFEGWFRDVADFSAQRGAGHLTCPICDSSVVRRVPSAVALAKGARPGNDGAAPGTPPRGITAALPPSATQILAAYRQFITVLKANSEDVGSGFAEEARRIHSGEHPERAIHGQATAEECARLAYEGIDFVRLPAVGEEELN